VDAQDSAQDALINVRRALTTVVELVEAIHVQQHVELYVKTIAQVVQAAILHVKMDAYHLA
jgi:hypothetical protein